MLFLAILYMDIAPITSSFRTQKDPAYYPDISFLWHESGILVLSYNTAGIPKSVHFPAASFNLKIRKSHWQINIFDICHTNKSRICHCFWKKISLSGIRCCTNMFLTIFSQIFPTDCFVTGFSVLTSKPAAFITQEFHFFFLLCIHLI